MWMLCCGDILFIYIKWESEKNTRRKLPLRQYSYLIHAEYLA